MTTLSANLAALTSALAAPSARLASRMAERSERDELVKIARELQVRAEDGGDEFDRLLAQFNRATRSTCDRRTFLFLHQSQEPEELVDTLLETRDAPPFSPPKTRAELEALFARLDAAAHPGHLELERAGDALAALSRLPRGLAHQLGSGFGQLPCWPPRAEIIDFALTYSPPTSREELLPLLERWIEDLDAGRPSVFVAVGEYLLRERQAALDLPGLGAILAGLASYSEVRREGALASLRKLLQLPEPRQRDAAKMASPSAPVTGEHVRHPKFGVGVVVASHGLGDGAKLTIQFGDGTRTVLARYVEPSREP